MNRKFKTATDRKIRVKYNHKYKSHLVDLPVSRIIILNLSSAKYCGLDKVSPVRGLSEGRTMTVLSATTVPIKGTELLGQQHFKKKDSSLRS